MSEKKWYPKIQKFLENEGYVCHGFFKNEKGKIEKGDFIDIVIGNIRIDVFGAKRPSSKTFNYQLETVGVEVKEFSKITIRNMRQAKSYSKLCTRCYLAAPVKKFTETEKKNAADLGIGLIKLRKPFEVVIESKKFQNDIDLINQFLKQLNVVFCATCRTYKHRYDPESSKYDGGSWRSDIFSGKYESKWTYICKECNEKFSKNTKKYLEDRDFGWIWDQIEKLEKQISQRKKEIKQIWDEICYLKEKMKENRNIDWKYIWRELDRLEKKIKKLK